MMLARFSGSLELEKYTYIGLGGPFLEDFRLVHARIGIASMVCVEQDKAVHERQKFNRPVPGVEFVHSTLEQYIDYTEFLTPVVLWLDYTEPKHLVNQIDRFVDTVVSVPEFSIVRITLNANPGSLGHPATGEIQTPPDGVKDDSDSRPTLLEWRLNKFKDRMGSSFPSDTKTSEMERTAYGKAILKALNLAVSSEMLRHPDKKAAWAFFTQYADGQPMVTATLLVLPAESPLGTIVEHWCFHSTPENPLVLDMPVLSPRERLTLEALGEKSPDMSYDFPPSNLGEDPVESFKRFGRVFPHFSRVDL